MDYIRKRMKIVGSEEKTSDEEHGSEQVTEKPSNSRRQTLAGETITGSEEQETTQLPKEKAYPEAEKGNKLYTWAKALSKTK